MASEFKTKASQRTQMGKGSEAYKAIVGVKGLVLLPPELVCPATGVEQFVNGGFETYSFTPWVKTETGGPCGPGIWDLTGLSYWGITPYEGSVMARFSNIGGSSSQNGTLEQDFATPIPVACFGGSSTFTVRTNRASGCGSSNLITVTIQVLYTDSTSTTLDISSDPSSVWTSHDLKAILVTGKTVKGVKFTVALGAGPFNLEAMFDACHLQK